MIYISSRTDLNVKKHCGQFMKRSLLMFTMCEIVSEFAIFGF